MTDAAMVAEPSQKQRAVERALREALDELGIRLKPKSLRSAALSVRAELAMAGFCIAPQSEQSLKQEQQG